MAIIENKVTREGDVLVIKPEVPIVGLIALYNFVDTTQNESQTDYFKKEFRYSVDGGMNFSDFIELTLSNLQGLEISKENQFVIEYKYTRVGNAPEVELEFDDILVSGTRESLPYPIYNTFFFKDFFEINNINVFGWALNVLEKLYLRGILPVYMTRGEKTSNILEDQDFLNFWNTITHYFALIVYYARQYKDLSSDEKLISLFLMNKDIQVGNSTVDEIFNLFDDYINQYKLKGTNQIIHKKTTTNDVNGELLRLINFLSVDEFIFALLKSSEMGWCIGKSSPIWNGTEKIINIIKAYEFTEEVVDLSKYPIKSLTGVSVVSGSMKIANVSVGSTNGIAPDGLNHKRIPVDENLDYEISFFVKVNSTSTKITFGLYGYDADGNSINFQRVDGGGDSNSFFEEQSLKISDQYYWIRGILYNKDATSDDSVSSFFPNGKNLKFKPNIKSMIPRIVLDNSNGSSATNYIYLYNVKIRPLKTLFTRGQLGMKNIILMYLKNRNVEISENKVENIIKTNLISANSFIKIKYLKEKQNE